MMKVLIADSFAQGGIEELRRQGADVFYAPELGGDSLVEAIRVREPGVLVVRSTSVTRPMLEAGPLRLVVRAGAGFNTIDVEAASERGILVANCPGKNSIAVAELTFGLILAIDRRIPQNAADLKQGIWNKKEYSNARGLFGRTLGIIGLGRIGLEVLARAQAFGMPVVAWSRSLTEQRAAELGVRMASSPGEVASAADVITVHLALTPETGRLLSADFFDGMRPSSTFINTSRAGVVDEVALVDAVRNRGIRAGLDVFADEPEASTGRMANEIFQLDGVIGTHHIGASTDQAQQAIAEETVRIICEYMDTCSVGNAVNLAKKTPATHLLVVTHHDRVGALAGILDELRGAGINVEEMQNVVFEGAAAAMARMQLSKALPNKVKKAITDSDSVIAVDSIRL